MGGESGVGDRVRGEGEKRVVGVIAVTALFEVDVGGRWFVAGEGGVGGVARAVVRGGESLGAGGRAKWGVLQAACPHVCSVVSSATCGRCRLFAPVVGCTGGCLSCWTRRRSQGVARAFVRGTDVPLWFPCTPLASSLMAVRWCGGSPGGDARLAQAISSALSTWVKTKATLRVRFALPSFRVFVVFFLPLALSSARSGPRRDYRPCVGSGMTNSLALCLQSTALGCRCCMSCLRGWLQRCPSCAVAVPGGADCRADMAPLSSCRCPSRSPIHGVVVWPSAFRHRQGDLDHYRNVENIWTFYLKNAVIKLENVEHRVDDRLRIIACDGRTPTTGAGAKKAKK